MVKKKVELSIDKVRDHLANERTFLSWIRTSIAIMAFGFVVEKFSLFLKQIAALLGMGHPQNYTYLLPTTSGYSVNLGITLVAIGALLCLLAFIKYKKIENQINSNVFQPTITIDLMLASIIFLIGLFLTIYLLNAI
jgi:putative membrane protein